MAVHKKIKAKISKRMSRLQISIFVVLFSVIGGYFIINSFAVQTGERLPGILVQSTGTQRFVSPTGSGNLCTEQAPCAMQTAISGTTGLSKASAGQRIEVLAGTYNVNINWSNVSGTEGAPITLASYNGAGVTLHSASKSEGYLFRIGDSSSYIRIKGIKFEANSNLYTGTGNPAVYVSGSTGAHDIDFIGNELAGFDAGTINGHDNTAFLTGPGATKVNVIGNKCHGWGTGNSGTQGRHCFYLQQDSGLIANNVIYNLAYGVGIQIRADTSQLKNCDVIVTNNTVVDVRGQWGIIVEANCTGAKIINNIVAYSGLNEIYGWWSSNDDGATTPPPRSNNAYTNLVWDTSGAVTGNVGGHNVLDFTDGVTGSSDYVGPGSNTNADPMFLNKTGRDYHLTSASSQAVGKAYLSYAMPYDFDGNIRDASPDLGAFERVSDTPTGPTANLWIDQNGGNCVRSETPVEYAGAGDTNSCSSSDTNPTQGAFNKAYKVAKPADLVLIKQGIYTTQEIDYKAGATAPNITIQAETGASVKVKELDIQSASYVTFKNFTVIPAGPDAKPDGSGGEAPYNQILDFGTASGQTLGAHHVTLDSVNVDGRQPDGTPSNRDASGINGNTSYITIKNADFGFIKGRKVMIIQNFGAKGPNDHLELDNVKLHDDPQWPDGGNHLECLWLSSTTNSLFNRLHLYNCALPMILSTFGDDLPPRTTTIQNSIFEASQGYGGNPGYYSIDGCLGRPSAGLFGSLNLKYNYFAIPLGCADGAASAGLKLVGNIGNANNCLSGALYSHNIWSAAKCDSTDVQNSAITNSINFMKLAYPFVNQPGDYRPYSGNAPQVNTGDSTLYPINDWRAYPTSDAAGNTRPAGGIPDVGPYEYTGGISTPKLPGDVNLDYTVNIDDLSILLSKWNTNYTPADFYKDNTIDISDLSILLGNWGKTN